ncbi:MAG TPA: hypothetical protein VIK99_02310 [Thermaerobacter sp.]
MPPWDDPRCWLWAAALACTALAAGYGWGWRQGCRHGRRLERPAAALWLRAEALERGICPVCDHVSACEAAGPSDPVVGDATTNGGAAPPRQRRGVPGPP